MTDRVHNLIDWGRSDELDSRDVGDLVSTVKALRSEIEASARARRVGEAVIAAGETGVWMVDEAIDSMRNGVGFDADDMPKLLAIRAALRGEP